jgi:aryl-alcohol dehydrogenase-like predicted oxidoreductase
VEVRALGTSDLRVSTVSLGAMTWGGGFSRETRIDDEAARRLLDAALDAGVNLVDTAETYGGALGRSEELLGRLVRGRREQVMLATKVGFADRGREVLRFERVIAACEASLDRLAVEHIDLYQVHRPDRSVPLDETVAALEELVRRGHIREFGFSNHRAWELAEVNARQRALGGREACAVQVSYSLATRDIEHEIQPYCHRHDVGVLVYSPLAGGQLAASTDTPSAAGRARFGALPAVDANRLSDARQALAGIAEGRGVSMAQVALAWVIAQPAITSVIVGPSRVEQLIDNVGAASLALSDQELAELDATTAPAALYPATLDRASGFDEPWRTRT